MTGTESRSVSAAKRDTAREQLTRQVLGANTLPEVEAAQKALREWIQAYPEERDRMRDGFEQLSLLQDIAEEEEARRLQQTTQAA
jgi:hypothetical protein